MEIQNLKESQLRDIIKFVESCDEIISERPSIFWLFWKFFRNTCFVVKKDDKIVGILLGLMDQTEKKVGFIHEIGVSKAYRRQGIASKMIDSFEKNIKEMGGTELRLTTFHTNKNAIKFYEKIGFKNNGEIKKIDQERTEFIKKIPANH